ncbi:hypothetical protein [Caenimonas aquaedulcis]|uniref:Uncharacterized protein n=1 Tax=Caenimonas aquaedulcis TaxID=2793270 RepID=A0A931H7S5_9BURK|nr:hypothetical protein [Caenimonas aquaedulcis]MBG9390265.1 hypothetical protein [Caenimonas aquaedulcis]
MALLGPAAIAMWWDMAPAHRVEFEDWHSHEHFPERLGIPGFLRGSRWADAAGGPGFFVMYELAAYETLSSPGYLDRLNNPTPWSRKLMPHHSRMVRSQCRVLESFGGGIAEALLTLRVSPAPGRGDALRAHLRDVLSGIPSRPGMTGAHLLHTQPPDIPQTREQQIRGGADAQADWVVLASGYDGDALRGLLADALGDNALSRAGALPGAIGAVHGLRLSMTAPDLRTGKED